MRKIKIIVFVLILIVNITWASDYTLEECYKAALRNDYSLSILNDDLAINQLDKKDAFSTFYPVIGTTGSLQYKSEAPVLDLTSFGKPGETAALGTKFAYDFNINLNQVFFDGFSRKYAILLSDNNLNRTRQERSLREDLIHQTILQLSYSYIMSNLNIEALSTSMKRLGFNLNQVKLFVDQGFSSELDLLDIQSKLKELEQQRLNLGSSMRKILLQISEISGLDDLDSLTIPDEYLIIQNSENLQNLEEKLAANGQLSLYEFSNRQIELKKKIDEASFYPSISGTAALHFGLPGSNLTGSDWQLYYTAGLQVQFHLWEGGRRNSMLKKDDLRLSQNVKSREAYLQSLYFDTLRNMDELVSLKDQRTEALDIYNLKKKKYEIVGNLWKAGQKSTLDVLSSEQEYTEADVREKGLRMQYLSLYQQILFSINESKWNITGELNED